LGDAGDWRMIKNAVLIGRAMLCCIVVGVCIGLVTLRAYGVEDRFLQRLWADVDQSNRR
jgi:hypothetical protein